jgi:DNA excision repair protein ERCC-5
MGVTGLWTIVHPCARPIKIETLNKRRLAVDASIWIYQFLKAVRDKEGNQLRNSHIVGFFRRICKLLFIGIKPVFIFDGGAPALKRQTINNRKRRREGRREDAARTAGKLLALQMQRSAEEEERKRREGRVETTEDASLPETFVYADEVHLSAKERRKNRSFRKADAYHLPDLEMSMAEMGKPNDPRVMSLDELQEYASQFNTGEDINLYDFSKIDFDGMFFQSLPPADQYNILNAARLRSRLRMGYSKDQLDSMFPDRMAFSKFQIERVQERNGLTQRLFRLQGLNEDGTLTMMDGSGRIAGEKGREYVLVKNDGVEGGWVLGVVTKKEGSKRDIPINVEEIDKQQRLDEDEGSDEDDEFEDVPIEGLNRLPKIDPRPGLVNQLLSNNIRRRRDFYKSRRTFANPQSRQEEQSDSLFVQTEYEDEDQDESNNQIEEGLHREEEEDLQRAIALSLASEKKPSDENQMSEDDDFEEVFAPQRRVEEPKPFIGGSGMSIAHLANTRSSKMTSKPVDASSDEEEDLADIQKALKQSKEAAYRTEPKSTVSQKESLSTENYPGFDGPLPFEKLNLGLSLFDGKKRDQNKDDEMAGGFVRDEDAPKKSKGPLPPWFTGKGKAPERLQEKIEKSQKSTAIEDNSSAYVFQTRAAVQKLPEIIDLEAEERRVKTPEIIVVDEEDEDDKMSNEPTPSPQHIEQSQATKVSEMPLTVAADMSNINLEADDNENDEGSEDGDMEWEDVPASTSIPEPVSASQRDPPLSFQGQATNMSTSIAGIDEPPIVILEDGRDVPEIDMLIPNEIKLEEDDEHLYSDIEDEELFRQIAQEEQEHERFTSSLHNRTFEIGKAEFEEELKRLRTQQKKDRRDADEVTQTMITECQQLLTLFGLPYITAPMEAEAQCAELIRLGLVDGVVTDDSDIFLFGGTRVYKNMFNQAKVVECYLSNDLETEFNLTRSRLISIAQLLGSDYTEGLPGIGPVTALEIISEFESLTSFRTWFTAVQNGTRSKADDAMSERSKFRKYATKITLPNSFPDTRVGEAYLKPEVDPDPSAFVWGVPDLDGLRSFLMHNIGWSPERTDEVLVPVIRDMNRRETEGTQSNITAFFGGSTGAGAFAPRQRIGGSKRLRSALERIGQKTQYTTENTGQSHNESTANHNDGNEDNEVMNSSLPRKRTRRKG